MLLDLACGSAKNDAPASKAKGALALANAASRLAAMKFDDAVAKALEELRATEHLSTGQISTNP